MFMDFENLSIVKMSILPKLVYRANAVLILISAVFLKKINTTFNSKIYKCKGSEIEKRNLKKQKWNLYEVYYKASSNQVNVVTGIRIAVSVNGIDEYSWN